jgi:hypothetical protein
VLPGHLEVAMFGGRGAALPDAPQRVRAAVSFWRHDHVLPPRRRGAVYFFDGAAPPEPGPFVGDPLGPGVGMRDDVMYLSLDRLGEVLAFLHEWSQSPSQLPERYMFASLSARFA